MRIEIANKIRNGRAVGTDYVVTRRDEGKSGIIAKFDTREQAEAFIASPRLYPSFDRQGRDVLMTVPE